MPPMPSGGRSAGLGPGPQVLRPAQEAREAHAGPDRARHRFLEYVNAFTGAVAGHWLRLRGPIRHPVTVAAVTWLLMVVTFIPVARVPLVEVQVGQVSPVDIEAPRTIENRYRTALLQQEAIRTAVRAAAEEPSNYAIDPAASVRAGDRVRRMAQLLQQTRQELWGTSGTGASQAGETTGRPPGRAAAEAAAGRIREAIDRLGLRPVAPTALRQALQLPPAEFTTAVQQAGRVAEELMGSLRISDGADEEAVMAARQRVQEILGASGKASEGTVMVAEALAMAAVGPNLVLDQEKVERLRQQAIQSVQPVMVLQRQIIARKGDLIGEEQMQLLADLGMIGRGGLHWASLAGIAAVTAGVVALFAFYLVAFHPEMARSNRMALLFATIALIVTLASRILAALPWSQASFLVPVALAGMLVALLANASVGLVMVTLLALLTGLVVAFDLRYVVVVFMTGVVAVFNTGRLGQRSDLTRTGLIAGVCGLLAMAAVGLLRDDMSTVVTSWAGLANGIGSAVLALGLLPFMEGLFGLVSPVRLMELSNPNQPLLRRLLLEAPGTYHHSLMVGNLAEAAAEAVGADPVLCRAGALYHDVGKIRRPYFFVENQFGDQNPHDRLAPSLSTLIIMSHVKDGVELAYQARLPQALIDFIRTHHGTDLIRFFYLKAVRAEGSDRVDEREYRYPGPRPFSKETAIVMLADSVEAAARSLTRPTPGRVEGLVRKVIRERLLDGQMDESTLTLQELNTIAVAFTKVLNGIYHTRIEYPERASLREVQPRRA